MKKIYTFIMLCSAAFAVSCSKDTASEAKTETFTIQMTAPQTKTHMVSGKAVWTSGDNVSVFSNNGTSKNFTVETSGEASTSLKCTDWVSGEIPAWGVFCYKDNQWQVYPVEQIADGKFKALVSSYQRVTSDNSFSSKSNLAVGKIVYNSESDGYSGQMMNALGLVKITVPVADIVKITLEDANGTVDIAGEVELDYNNGEPVCTVVPDKGSKSIYVERRSGSNTISFTAGKSVYFCVLPNVSFKPKFTFEKSDGSTTSVTGNMEISVNRSNFVDLGTPNLEFIPKGYVKNVVTLDFTTAWPLTPACSNSTESARAYAYGDYSFGIKADIDASYFYSSKRLTFSNKNAGGAYIQFDAPSDGYIAKIAFTHNTAEKKYELSSIDEKEIVWSGTFAGTSGTNNTKEIDLTDTTSAKNGCRLIMRTAKSQYQITKLEVTYYVKEQSEQ